MADLQLLILGLMAVGFVLAKRSVVPPTASAILSSLLMNLFLPSVILISFQMPGGLSHIGALAGLLFCSALVQTAYFILSRLLFNKMPPERAKTLKYGIICNNASMMGVPIVEAAYGQVGGMYASVALLPMRIFVWSAGVMIFSGEKVSWKSVTKLVWHPCVITVIIGVGMMLLDLKYPPFLTTLLGSLARCTTPMSMLTIGLILGSVEFRHLFERNLVFYTVLRLLLIPAAVGAVAYVAGVPHFTLAVLVLMAGMPAGSTTAILAAQYHSDEVYASKCVLVSIIASALTLPLWMWVLAQMAPPV